MWAVMFTAFLFALSMTTTANALVVMAVSPLLTAVFAWMFLKDPLPARTWIAAGAALLGIAWMFSAQLSAHYAGMAVASSSPSPRRSTSSSCASRHEEEMRDLVPAVMLGGALSCLIALPLPCLFLPTRDIVLLAFLGFFQLGLPCMLLVLASRALPRPRSPSSACSKWCSARSGPGSAPGRTRSGCVARRYRCPGSARDERTRRVQARAGRDVINPQRTRHAAGLHQFRGGKPRHPVGSRSGAPYSCQLLICSSGMRTFDSASTKRCASWMFVMSGMPKSAALRRIR